MDRIWRKCWDADGDVLGPFRRRTAVPHPFPGLHDDRLPGTNIELGIFQFDVQASNSGVCPGSAHPDGLFMRAMLTAVVLEFTRPMNSSISFGG
jgi:hypothetical protein